MCSSIGFSIKHGSRTDVPIIVCPIGFANKHIFPYLSKRINIVYCACSVRPISLLCNIWNRTSWDGVPIVFCKIWGDFTRLGWLKASVRSYMQLGWLNATWGDLRRLLVPFLVSFATIFTSSLWFWVICVADICWRHLSGQMSTPVEKVGSCGSQLGSGLEDQSLPLIWTTPREHGGCRERNRVKPHHMDWVLFHTCEKNLKLRGFRGCPNSGGMGL